LEIDLGADYIRIWRGDGWEEVGMVWRGVVCGEGEYVDGGRGFVHCFEEDGVSPAGNKSK
jgi:hypothetical protein